MFVILNKYFNTDGRANICKGAYITTQHLAKNTARLDLQCNTSASKPLTKATHGVVGAAVYATK